MSIKKICLLGVLGLTRVKGCDDLLRDHKTDQAMLQKFREESASDSKVVQTRLDECLDLLIRHNYFESVKFLINTKFGEGMVIDRETGRALSKAPAGVGPGLI